MSSPVPEEWTRICGNRQAAQVAQDVIANPAASAAQLTEAETRYHQMAGAIVADLGALAERGELGRITLLLSRRERK